jgi:thiol-disulfide isomerase/thioredoxin
VPAPPRLPWRAFVLSTVLALAAAVATYALLVDDDTGTEAAVVSLDPAEDLPPLDEVTFTTFEGDEVALASLRGTPVLVNFFASTCIPCITEMPAFEEVHQELGDEVTFLGLAAAGDRPEDALALVEDTEVTYRTARDVDGDVMNALGGTLLPTTVLLDADGEIISRHAGELDADEVRALLAEALEPTP